MDRIPDDLCLRTGSFEVVFTDTQLAPDAELHVGREEDAEWQEAADLMLAVLRAEQAGETASNAAWQDLMMWLNADEKLETFIQRTLKTVDASTWLLSLAVKELGSNGESDTLKRLHQLVLSQPVRG